MIVFKYINLICILLICAYLGKYKSQSYENRVFELNRFQNALIMFKSKIEFTYEPLKNIFEDISKSIYENDENIFSNALEDETNITLSWNRAVNNTQNSFNKEDREHIKMLGKMLGKTDVKGQVNEIDLCISLINMQLNKAELEKEKNCKLFKTIGIVLGLGICIVLI